MTAETLALRPWQDEDGVWGFVHDDQFWSWPDAFKYAETHDDAFGRGIFGWKSLFCEAMSLGQLVPDVETRDDGVIPRWRIQGIGALTHGGPFDGESGAVECQAFLDDVADHFVRRQVYDLEVARVIAGPLGRRLIARLARPPALWDVNQHDRQALLSAIQEWHLALSDPTLKGSPGRGQVLRLSGLSNPEITVMPEGIAQNVMAEWALRFPPWQRAMRSYGMEPLVIRENEADEFWRDELPALVAEGVRVELPEGFRRPKMTVRGTVRGQDMRKPALGLDGVVSVDWDVLLDGMAIDRETVRQMAETKAPLVRVGGRWVVMNQAILEEARRAYERLKKSRLKMSEAVRLSLEGDAAEVQVLTTGQIASLLGRLRSWRTIHSGPTDRFQGTLRPYQLDGVKWLRRRMECGVGALLADDMGLGKTVEVIAALSSKEADREEGPVLVICPLSVVNNWEREVARFLPSCRVVAHVGTGRATGQKFRRLVESHDVVLTTYDVLLRDIAEFETTPWAGVVADEAQQLKNPRTKRARAIRRLKASWRIAMTGTPVENRIGDLWAEMEFLNPGYLGTDMDFRRRFERTGTDGEMDTLRRLLDPFVLRRVKTDPEVMPDLPEKVEITESTLLTPEQMALYQATLDRLWSEVETGEPLGRMKRRGAIVAALTHLKQVIDHPAVFLHESGPVRGRSGKLARLEELLSEILDADDRVVIFTQYVALGLLLKPYLSRHFHVPVALFHGGLSKSERDRVLVEFDKTEGPPILIASLKAGGVGLNLNRAQHVIHYDRWWNPAVEDQATDRVWRLGQTRAVTVHKFVTRGTVEERIEALMQSKRSISKRVLTGDAVDLVATMDNQQLRELIELRETVWITD